MAQGVLDSSYAAERLRRPPLVFRYRARASIVAAAAARHLEAERPLRVLDLGSAEGRTLLELHSLLGRGEILGVEEAQELIDLRPELPPGVSLVQGDVTELDDFVEPASRDLVSALAILEHLPDPLTAVRAARRALRPGGLFVATVPQPAWDRIATRLGLLRSGQHETALGRRELIHLASDGGLELLSYRRFMWAPLGILPYLGLPVSPALAARADGWIRRLRLLDWLFVNQALIARRVPGASKSAGRCSSVDDRAGCSPWTA